MTTQTNAQRLADELGQGHPLEDTVSEASQELRRLSAIERARDVAVEMAAQYAAERDQLRIDLTDEMENSAAFDIERAERIKAQGEAKQLAKMLDEARAQLAAVGGTQSPSDEPFGYFRAEPFGWTDCEATDDGAIALYERPQPATPKPVPMTDEQVFASKELMHLNGSLLQLALPQLMLIVRAIEAHHGIVEKGVK